MTRCENCLQRIYIRLLNLSLVIPSLIIITIILTKIRFNPAEHVTSSVYALDIWKSRGLVHNGLNWLRKPSLDKLSKDGNMDLSHFPGRCIDFNWTTTIVSCYNNGPSMCRIQSYSDLQWQSIAVNVSSLYVQFDYPEYLNSQRLDVISVIYVTLHDVGN